MGIKGFSRVARSSLRARRFSLSTWTLARARTPSLRTYSARLSISRDTFKYVSISRDAQVRDGITTDPSYVSSYGHCPLRAGEHPPPCARAHHPTSSRCVERRYMTRALTNCHARQRALADLNSSHRLSHCWGIHAFSIQFEN